MPAVDLSFVSPLAARKAAAGLIVRYSSGGSQPRWRLACQRWKSGRTRAYGAACVLLIALLGEAAQDASQRTLTVRTLSPAVDYLDVIIIVFLVLFALSGLRRGLSGVAFSLAGLLVGLFLGAVHRAADRPCDHLQPDHATALRDRHLPRDRAARRRHRRGDRVPHPAAHQARRSSARPMPRSAPSSACSAPLAAAWYLGPHVLAEPVGRPRQPDQRLHDRADARRLHAAASGVPRHDRQPLPPGRLPEPVLDDPEPPADARWPSPRSSTPPGIREAASVNHQGHRGRVQRRRGGRVVVAARAGIPRHQCARRRRLEQCRDRTTPTAGTTPQRVVLFDPNTDLAILYVARPHAAAAPSVNQDPARGTGGAVIGYPGGNASRSSPRP